MPLRVDAPAAPEQVVRLAFLVRFNETRKTWLAVAVADPSIVGEHAFASLALTAAFREAEKRNGTAPYADPETADKHCIARILSGRKLHDRRVPTIGWQARIDRYHQGKRVLIATRFFGDHTYGGAGYALAQAIEFRDKFEYLRALPLARALAKARALGINSRQRARTPIP